MVTARSVQMGRNAAWIACASTYGSEAEAPRGLDNALRKESLRYYTIRGK